MGAVFAQTFGKTGIVGITKAALGSDQGIQASLQSLSALTESSRLGNVKIIV